MSNVVQTIHLLKERWGTPREAVHRGRLFPVPLACTFAPESGGSIKMFSFEIPEDIREFWLCSGSATLFKDQKYGQWGIEILGPAGALRETLEEVANRPRDFSSTDLVLARFFGDSDLIVISCDPKKPDFGFVYVALPIDRRQDWPLAAESFGEFLERLTAMEGDKFWCEERPR